MSYLLSVIIPTKDRYLYLKDCLKSLVSIKSSEIEIVVQDNTTDNDEIKKYIKDLKWPHIKYYHESKPLSQSENSELAVKNATGKYICYIGDDDTITSQMIEIVKWLNSKNIESCIFPVAIYYWPDVVFKFFKYPTLSFSKGKIKIRYLNPIKELKRCLAKGATTLENMPKVYHGIVSKEALDEVYRKTGFYFPGPSPDMANATALSLIIKEHIRIEIPLMISGYSYKSAGGMGLRGAHKARIKDVAQLPADTEENWETRIPKVWLASTIWCESCVKALRAMKEEKLIERIDWNYLYAKMLVFNLEFLSDIKPHMQKFSSILHTYKWFILLLSQRSCNFILNFIRTKLKITSKKTYNEVQSLQAAMEIVNNYNKSINYREKIV